MDYESEIKRIKVVYNKRKEKESSQLYSLFRSSHLFMAQMREFELIKVLKRFGINSFHNKKIVDIGCGNGWILREFIQYGAMPQNLYGVDLLQDRIETAKKINPNIDFRQGDASNLPFGKESFDMVMQLTVFTSILHDEMKQNISREMLRILKPDGIILWYDYHMDNPQNNDVKGIKSKEINDLFPNCNIYLLRITLAPPITRLIAPYSWLTCYLLEKLRIFNSHYLGVIKKHHS